MKSQYYTYFGVLSGQQSISCHVPSLLSSPLNTETEIVTSQDIENAAKRLRLHSWLEVEVYVGIGDVGKGFDAASRCCATSADPNMGIEAVAEGYDVGLRC